MPRNITFKGSPMTLVGRALKPGSLSPEFKATSQDLKEVSLSDFKGKVKIITSFPSLDTPVCDLQVKEFNKRAGSFSGDVVIIGISKDLPFAQKRFCHDFEIKNISVVSDFKASSFGLNFGLLVKELNLLARSINIVDKNNVLRYMQVVPELTQPPDYDSAIKELENVINNPKYIVNEELPRSCKPCEGGIAAMPEGKVQELLALHKGWLTGEGKKISKEFKFRDFTEARYFLDLISIISEEQGHHPSICIIYNKVKITLTTHAIGGLSDNDFIMAGLIDDAGGA